MKREAASSPINVVSMLDQSDMLYLNEPSTSRVVIASKYNLWTQFLWTHLDTSNWLFRFSHFFFIFYFNQCGRGDSNLELLIILKVGFTTRSTASWSEKAKELLGGSLFLTFIYPRIILFSFENYCYFLFPSLFFLDPLQLQCWFYSLDW